MLRHQHPHLRHLEQHDISNSSFQIPSAVDATANNLLLDDDPLDFFDGADYTLSTPVPIRSQPSNLHQLVLDPIQLTPTPRGRGKPAGSDNVRVVSPSLSPEFASPPQHVELKFIRNDRRTLVTSPSLPSLTHSEGADAVAPRPSGSSALTLVHTATAMAPRTGVSLHQEDDHRIGIPRTEEEMRAPQTSPLMVSTLEHVPWTSEVRREGLLPSSEAPRVEGFRGPVPPDVTQNASAVTVPITEAEEDLRSTHRSTSIPKPGPSVPKAAPASKGKRKLVKTAQPAASSSSARDRSESELDGRPRLKVKGEELGGQPSKKKRKTLDITASLGPNALIGEPVHFTGNTVLSPPALSSTEFVAACTDTSSTAEASVEEPNATLQSESFASLKHEEPNKETLHMRALGESQMKADTVRQSHSNEAGSERVFDKAIAKNTDTRAMGKSRDIDLKKMTKKVSKSSRTIPKVNRAQEGTSDHTRIRNDAIVAPDAAPIRPCSEAEAPTSAVPAIASSALQISNADVGIEATTDKYCATNQRSMGDTVNPQEIYADPSQHHADGVPRPPAARLVISGASSSLATKIEASRQKPKSATEKTRREISRIADPIDMPKKTSDLQSRKNAKAEQQKPRADDMFERKKRDTYLHKGIDLTAHSTSRFRKKGGVSSGNCRTVHRTSGQDLRVRAERQRASSSRNQAGPSKPRSVAGQESGIEAIHAVDSDPDSDERLHASRTGLPDSGSQAKPTGCGESGFAARSSGTYGKGDWDGRTSDSDHDRNKASALSSNKYSQTESDALANTSSSSIGGVIAERLLGFGQKVMGSFGLLAGRNEATDREIEEIEEHDAIVTEHEDTVDRTSNRGGPYVFGTSTLRLSELSPRKRQPRLDRTTHEAPNLSGHERNEDKICPNADDFQLNGGSEGGLERMEEYGIDGSGDDGITEYPKTRKSLKRSAHERDSDANSLDANLDIKTDLETCERSLKRSKVTGKDAFDAGTDGIMASLSQGDSQAISALSAAVSHAEGTKSGKRGEPATFRKKLTTNEARRPILNRNRGRAGTGINISTAHSSDRRRQQLASSNNKSKALSQPKDSCRLTIPITTIFSGDVLREQRLLAKSEREKTENREAQSDKGRLIKSASASVDTSAKPIGVARAPLSDKPIMNVASSRPTVPQVFRFETDTRIAHRRQEFEEKMKTWENRASSSVSSNANGLSQTNRPIPDFRSSHNTHDTVLAGMAIRRREMIKPTIPVTPHFSTDQRVIEREKFDLARRAREEELERQMEEARRAREIEEEKEWREARKRAVPRANAIPEWYANAPKKVGHA